MKEDEFKQLLKGVEQTTLDWDHEYSMAFERIFTDNEQKLTDEQKKLLRWDVLLFRLRTINQLDENGKPRFMPMIEYTNGNVFPGLNEFTEDAVKYIGSRASEVEHAIIKARYLDFVWEHGGKENKYEVGKQLVMAYLDAFDMYPLDKDIERVDCLQRAVFIATRLEKKKASELTAASIKKLQEYLALLKSNETYRWIYDSLKIVLKHSNQFATKQLKDYVQYIEDGIVYYSTKDFNSMILPSYYELKFDFLKSIDPKAYSQTDLAEDKAQISIRQAEDRTESTFVQQHFYSEAADLYKKAGLTKKSDEMVQKIKDIGQDPDYDKQFKSVSHTVRIPQEEIDRMKTILGTGQRVPMAIGLSPVFIPSWEHAQKLSADLDGKFVAHKIFTTTYLGDNGYPIGSSANDPDAFVKQQYQTEASLKHTMLSSLLQEKLTNKEVHFKDFDKHFEKIKEIDAPTYETVKHGLKRFFAKDYLSANMILTTQFEDLLRKLMPLFGLNSTMMHPTERDAYSEKTLNRIIEDCRPIVGENMYRLFEYVLVDRKALYLRHKDAHGFIKLEDNNYYYCVLILQLYCHLLAGLRRE